MENKLQELTQKLYEQGLVKGREQANTLLASAELKAKKIVDNATQEAERIILAAKKNGEELASNTLAEISLAGMQAVAMLKAEINKIIIAKSVTEAVSVAAMDPAFIKEMLLAVAKNWEGSTSQTISLKALLPLGLESKLDSEFKTKVMTELNNGIEISYSESVGSGFKIGPKDGGYYISFTDSDFDALLQQHLRGQVSEILYANKG